MISIERYFENIFTQKEITAPRLSSFATSHLARLKADNPGGIYDVIITATETVLDTFKADITEIRSDKGTLAGGVKGKKLARKAFIDYLAQKEGLVKGVFGKRSPQYKEFFPHGINVFRHATDSEFSSLANVAVMHAIKFEPQLGSDFRNELTAKRDAFKNAFQLRSTEEGETSASQFRGLEAKTALQIQLCSNICFIAIYNMGMPEKAKEYFEQHLLFPAKKHHLFKAKIEGSETKRVCTFKYSEGKRFHIMVTGAGPLTFQMSLNGVIVGRQVLVKPREKFNESFGFFSSAGDSLVVTNPNEQRGSYMIWEIA
ncbi:MAG: hypothetical protein V4615_15405 [Bacteroidota bacterium]